MTRVGHQSVSTHTFEWGNLKWFVTPDGTEGSGLTFGEVILLPGKGHDRHNHPESEEILYVLSGEGEQMLDDDEPFTVRAGDTIHISAAMFHATRNSGWEPLRLLALYNPGGAEKGLEELPDHRVLPPGEVPNLNHP